MALDLDVDDGPSFQDLVQSGRRDVLKGRVMEQCWSELADQHPFFKDIAKEGRLRGETLGTVLAAVAGLSRAIRRVEALTTASAARGGGDTPVLSPSPPSLESDTMHTNDAAAAAAASPQDDHVNAEMLVRVADAYSSLYSTTPVPTRLQWLTVLEPASAARGAVAAVVADAEDANMTAAVSSSSPVGRYLGKLRRTVQEVAGETTGNGEDDGDDGSGAEDGSFAEEELRELLRCCMVAGRRAARYAGLAKAEAKMVREMVKALQDFVGSATLEW